MSKPSHIIPKLNKIIEAYTEVEKKTVQETQSREIQAEARAKDIIELRSIEEESRKRNRGVEAEKRGAEKVRSLILDKATALMEKSLKDRGFIVERGFNRLIFPFAEMLEKRGWQSLGEHKEPRCAALVKVFFVNMVEEEGNKVYVRGHWIDFNREKINRGFNLKVQKDGSI